MLLFFLILLSAWLIVTGAVLVHRTDSAFGAVGATPFVLCGLILAMPVAMRVSQRWWVDRLPLPRREELDGEEAEFHPRRTGWPAPLGILVPGSLGLWFRRRGVIGGVESWGWPVLFAVPATYFLGVPVLWRSGRFRPAGAWLTPTRIVNEHFGLRSELAVRDVAILSPWSTQLVAMPREGTPVRHRKLTPRPWRARLVPDRLVINTEHLSDGGTGLAVDIQRLLDVHRRR